MPSDRLLSILLLLQARGRMTARELAGEVEASVRTIHRDVERLSAAGVPVYAVRGRDGGFELLDGWQTRLTGLTASEAGALALMGLPGPGADLGLGAAIDSARRKLLAALPAGSRDAARRIGARFHLDPAGWFRTAERPEHLPAVAAAVWAGGRLAIRYESWSGIAERDVDALGLVLKAGVWYLVGGAEGGPRTYRLSSILALATLDERFVRPRDFDLAAYWDEATRRFEAGIYRATAVLRGPPGLLARLHHAGPSTARAAEWAAETPGRDGTVRVTIAIESGDVALREVLALGPDVEVEGPRELRRRIRELARDLLRVYARDEDGDDEDAPLRPRPRAPGPARAPRPPG